MAFFCCKPWLGNWFQPILAKIFSHIRWGKSFPILMTIFLDWVAQTPFLAHFFSGQWDLGSGEWGYFFSGQIAPIGWEGWQCFGFSRPNIFVWELLWWFDRLLLQNSKKWRYFQNIPAEFRMGMFEKSFRQWIWWLQLWIPTFFGRTLPMGFGPDFLTSWRFFLFFLCWKNPSQMETKIVGTTHPRRQNWILIRKCSEDSVLVNPIANGVINVGLERSTWKSHLS